MMNCGDIVREKATATKKPCVRVGEDDDQWERENLVHTQRAEWISYDKGWQNKVDRKCEAGRGIRGIGI